MRTRRWSSAGLAVLVLISLTACGGGDSKNLVSHYTEETETVNLFSPMEKTDPDAENVARTASDQTVTMAEEALNVTVVYRT